MPLTRQFGLAVVVGVAGLVAGGAVAARAVDAQDSVFFGQVGADIGCGTDSGLALSGDGNRLVVGGEDVRAFEWDGGGWAPMGAPIPIATAGPSGEKAVDISLDGTTVAVVSMAQPWEDDVGFVRVLRWDGVDWAPVGADIVGPTSLSRSPVAISADGSRVAVGSWSADGGAVFGWNGADWVPVGDPISPGGNAVAMSDDGNRLAVGYSGSEDGSAWVHQWNGTEWVLLGGEIVSEPGADYFGESVSLSADGARLAVGAPASEGWENAVYVFDWDGSEWGLVGDPIAEPIAHFFGQSVDLSADGARLAVKAAGNEYIDQSGYVRVLDWNGTTWMPVTDDFASVPGDAFSGLVALSADGSRVAAQSGGTAQVFEQGYSVTPEPPADDPCAPEPPPPPAVIFEQRGDDIAGRLQGMSADGSRVAVLDGPGRRFDLLDPEYAVPAYVHEWVGDRWAPLGGDVSGDGAQTMALSGSGDRVAIGDMTVESDGEASARLRVFEWDGAEWSQVGSAVEIAGTSPPRVGSVALSADGRRLAATVVVDPPLVELRVFDAHDGVWAQTGATVIRESSTRGALAMSADGSTIGWATDGIAFDGSARVDAYRFGGVVWNASLVTSSDDPGQLVEALALSANGNVMVVGAAWASPPDDPAEELAGRVQVFGAGDGSSVDNEYWVQIGGDLYGPTGDRLLGTSVAATESGQRIAAVQELGDAVDVYDWDGTRWELLETLEMATGFTPLRGVALSGDGSRIAVGVLDFEVVRVFDLVAPTVTTTTTTTTTTTPPPAPSTTMAPPPTTLPPTGNPTVGLRLAGVMLATGLASLLLARRPHGERRGLGANATPSSVHRDGRDDMRP